MCMVMVCSVKFVVYNVVLPPPRLQASKQLSRQPGQPGHQGSKSCPVSRLQARLAPAPEQTCKRCLTMFRCS